MNSTIVVFVVLGLIATLGVLFFGLFTMARGGEFNAKHGNKIMRWRVILQAGTLVLFVIMVLLTRD